MRNLTQLTVIREVFRIPDQAQSSVMSKRLSVPDQAQSAVSHVFAVVLPSGSYCLVICETAQHSTFF